MIKLIQKGTYKLIESKRQTKILMLDKDRNIKIYAWINAAEIGEILVVSHKTQKIDCILAKGKYRIYQIKDEPRLTDLIHLELLVGEGLWQGYLLPNGLPTEEEKKHRIVPTGEIITKSTH